MGYLDNSTNNIVVDAVLTDIGREFLARGDGSFSIVKFALGDDEIDYSIIEKFGRTIGREKVEKNTPIFEALTGQDQALKYRMISVSNPGLLRLPRVSLTGEGLDSTGTVVTMGRTTTRRRTLTVSQEITDETTIDVELRDQVFEIEVNNDFLQLSGVTPDTIDSLRRARYMLPREAGESSVGGSRVTFTLQVKNVTDDQYTVFGNVSNKNVIKTVVRVRGINSGATKLFNIEISKSG